MDALFTFIVYVHIYVCLHYFATNVFNSFVWKDSSGFSSPIFPIINSHVFSHNNKKLVLYYCAFRLLRFVILSSGYEPGFCTNIRKTLYLLYSILSFLFNFPNFFPSQKCLLLLPKLLSEALRLRS
jgi:hypothetical protein